MQLVQVGVGMANLGELKSEPTNGQNLLIFVHVRPLLLARPPSPIRDIVTKLTLPTGTKQERFLPSAKDVDEAAIALIERGDRNRDL